LCAKQCGGGKIEECAGTLYRRNGSIISGPERELIRNIDSLPFPDFSDFDFFKYDASFKIPISSSRGCVNRCIYCNELPYWKKYRARSGESMFAEAKYQLERYPHVYFFDFQDSLVNGDIRALESFCDLILSNNVKIKWSGQAIIRKEMTYGLFTKLKKSGCVSLAYGLETTSMALMERIGKVFSKDVNIDQLIDDSYRAGVSCVLNFMFGLPGETDEDALINIEFIKRNSKKITAVNPSPGFCAICPGTIAYKNPGKYNLDISKGYDYWESKDGANNYITRIERFEHFIANVHRLGIPSVYSHPKLINKNELLANYYFTLEDYEKAISYYEEAAQANPDNRVFKDKLRICHTHTYPSLK
jgi:radical SAM superfamily enzyme YgiQ (UPF0313 family)